MSQALKHKWDEFHSKSDRAYENALDGEIGKIQNHNIIKDCDREISFCFQLLGGKFNTVLNLSSLDVCCGAGFMSEELRKRGYQATGIDISESGIKLAKSLFSEIEFHQADAANPSEVLKEQSFDFILIREAHPFSRIDDFEFQQGILEQYMKLLKPGGGIVISHARKGGGMSFPSVNFSRLKKHYRKLGWEVRGPYYFFLFKHLKLPLLGDWFLSLVSYFTGILSSITGSRWLEVFVLKDSR